MTREEAVNFLAVKIGFAPNSEKARDWIELFETLGMLKLDDPAAKMRDNAAMVLVGRNYDGAFITGTAACQMIDSLLINGFKITR